MYALYRSGFFERQRLFLSVDLASLRFVGCPVTVDGLIMDNGDGFGSAIILTDLRRASCIICCSLGLRCRFSCFAQTWRSLLQ